MQQTSEIRDQLRKILIYISGLTNWCLNVSIKEDNFSGINT